MIFNSSDNGNYPPSHLSLLFAAFALLASSESESTASPPVGLPYTATSFVYLMITTISMNNASVRQFM